MFAVRAGFWYVNGLKNYGKSGFLNHQKSYFQPIETDMKDLNCIITGSNANLGKAIAMNLAKRNANVHLVCRNEEKANKAKEDIVRKSGNEQVFVHVCDMSDMESIRRFCRKFQTEVESLDVVVHNAAIMGDKKITKQGVEVHFATNVLGPYLFTELLLPMMRRGKRGENDFKPRVILMSSGGMLTCKMSLDFEAKAVEKFDGTMAYAQNKRAQIYLVEEWTKKYNNEVFFFSTHPGWVDTDALRTAMPGFYDHHKNMLRDCNQGADTAVWLSTLDNSCELKKMNGEFIFDREVVRKDLPLSSTKSSPADVSVLMNYVNEISKVFIYKNENNYDTSTQSEAEFYSVNLDR